MGLADADNAITATATLVVVHRFLLCIHMLNDPVLTLEPVTQWKRHTRLRYQRIQHLLNIFEITPKILQLLSNTLANQIAAGAFAFADGQICFTCLLTVSAGLLAGDLFMLMQFIKIESL